MVVANNKISLVRERLKHFDSLPLNQEDFRDSNNQLSESKGFFAERLSVWSNGTGLKASEFMGCIWRDL